MSRIASVLCPFIVLLCLAAPAWAQQIVFSANDRCQQENLIAQLAAVRALHAPVDNLLSNEAYMLMTALAWNLKAWLALSLPEETPQKMPSSRASRRMFVSASASVTCSMQSTRCGS